MPTFQLLTGDCIETLKTLEDNSVDAIVTDPPYGLEFMGKEWDKFATGRATKYAKGGEITKADFLGFDTLPQYVSRPAKRCGVCGKQAWSGSPCKCDQPQWVMDNSPLHAFQQWCTEWAVECLRVLKPGGHLLAFGGTRTYHRLTSGLEDAGFEIRDSIHWTYGSGFPKSLNVGKAIDKAAGAERDVVGRGTKGQRVSSSWDDGSATGVFRTNADGYDITTPATPEAQKWEGWGTALKPSHEPIVLARKPLESTVANNVLKHGTGALNINECRIGTEDDIGKKYPNGPGDNTFGGSNMSMNEWKQPAAGRWPANTILTHHQDCENTCVPGCPIPQLDQQSGESTSTQRTGNRTGKQKQTYGQYQGQTNVTMGHNDKGGASRYYQQITWNPQYDHIVYHPKASKKDRNTGLDGLPPKKSTRWPQNGIAKGSVRGAPPAANNHPTVKPVNLMRYLIKLITPPNGVVLDPFLGSGTTAVAAILEGHNIIGCEKTEEYLPIITARVNYAQQQTNTQQQKLF